MSLYLDRALDYIALHEGVWPAIRERTDSVGITVRDASNKGFAREKWSRGIALRGRRI